MSTYSRACVSEECQEVVISIITGKEKILALLLQL